MSSLAATTTPERAGAAGVATAANPVKGADVSLSKIFIARQPIFDLQQKVYGYELLFRSGFDNVFKTRGP